MTGSTSWRVIEVIARRFAARGIAIDRELITLDASFSDLGIDSLTVLDILQYLETEFSIEIPNEEVTSMRDVRMVVELVERQQSGDRDQAESLEPVGR